MMDMVTIQLLFMACRREQELLACESISDRSAGDAMRQGKHA